MIKILQDMPFAEAYDLKACPCGAEELVLFETQAYSRHTGFMTDSFRLVYCETCEQRSQPDHF